MDEDEKRRKYWWGRGCYKEKALPAIAENFDFKISDGKQMKGASATATTSLVKGGGGKKK